MKKIITLSMVAIALVLAPVSISLSHAQNLTRADVQTIAPGLTQVISSLSNIISNEVATRNAENAAINNMYPVLSSIVTQINQSGNNLTTSQFNTITGQLSSIQNLLSNITNRRMNFLANLRPISSTLNTIAIAIASAK